MAAAQLKYETHFKPDQQVTAAIHLANKKFLESNAVVTSIENNVLCMELIGEGIPANTEIEAGAELHVTCWTGWAHYRCHGRLESTGNGKQICVKLAGPVVEQQRRDYFRLDMVMPVTYQVLKTQNLSNIEEEWIAERDRLLSLQPPQMEQFGDGFRVVEWNGGEDLLPVEVNLSGGGIRFKVSELVLPGAMIGIDLFLPLAPSRVIHTVAEVLRCTEIRLRWEKGTQYTVAMRFHRINEKERDTIISYIFSEQRRLLQLSQERIVPIR